MTAAAPAPTCLVLGGRGFVGSAIVREAEARGWRTIPVDVDNYAAVTGSACDVLVNANGNSRKYLGARDPAQEFDLSVRSVMRSLHDFRFARYVFLSTIDVYPEHADPALNREDATLDEARMSPYGFHKYLAERLVRRYAPAATVLRMGGFVGPGLKKNSIYDLLRGEAIRVHPDSAYQYQHTSALARTALDLAVAPEAPATVNVCGDGLVTLREIAALIPGRRLDPALDQLPRERYEVNIDRLKSLRPVATTRDTVRAFVEAVAAGREALA